MFPSKVEQQSIFLLKIYIKTTTSNVVVISSTKIQIKLSQSITVQSVKSQLSSNYNSRHKIKILSTNNLTIIKRCMINISYRFKRLFLINLCHFLKLIQIIDFFFRKKIFNVVIIILKLNFIFFKVCFYNEIFIFL